MATKVKRKPVKKISRNLKKKHGISKFQALAIGGVLAVIGVVAVVASHASGTPNYQYSAGKYCVSANGKTSAEAIKDCKNTSAEALVYRLYKGLYNRKPDSGGYKYWTQQFAGERTQPTKSALVVDQVNKMGTDTAFVKNLYVNMFGRSGTVKEVNYWTKKLSDRNGWTRQQVAVNFATSKEAINKNQEAFTAFMASAPTVAVVQTAAAKQRQRFDDMLLKYEQPTKSDMGVVSNDVAAAQAQLNAASATASKKVPTKNDLNAIKNNQVSAQNSYSHAKARAAVARGREAEAKKVMADAQALANFATDIRDFSTYGIKQIQKRYNATKVYATTTTSKANGIQATIGAISSKYGVAEKKYEDELKRQEAIRAEQERIRKEQDAANQANIDRWLLQINNNQCYSFSYSVDQGKSKDNSFKHTYYDVILSSRGANKQGCSATATKRYDAYSYVEPGKKDGPHFGPRKN
jgi:hypothetical protein